MPFWWIKAYQWTASVESRFLTPAQLLQHTKLNPCLHLVELEALASVLNDCQHQLLSGNDNIVIDSIDHSKRGTQASLQQKFIFDRLPQILSSLGLLVKVNESRQKVEPLFSSMSVDYGKDDETTLFNLSLNTKGSELVLGFINPFADLIRFTKDDHALESILGFQPPLKLWRSLWLDMHPIECSLLLRLEKAGQWDAHYLSFDGIFGLDLNELFRGLDLPGSRRKNSQKTPFLLKKRVLERFGRKLREHGYIRDDFICDILPTAKTGALNLLWHASGQYLSDLNMQDYLSTCWSKVFEPQISKELNFIVNIASPHPLRSSQLQKYLRFWKALHQSKEQDFYFCIDGNRLISVKALYWEWCVRAELSEGSGLAIPKSERVLPLIELLTENLGDELDANLKKFICFFKEDPALSKLLETVPGLSLTSRQSRLSPELTLHFSAAKPMAPRLEEYEPRFVPAQKDKEKPVQSNDLNTSAQSISAVQEPVKKSNQTLLSKQEALEKIDLLRRSSLKRYETLKAAYIETLAPEKRSIILEVRQRLQPKVFDDHLRNSLAKYISENPEILKNQAKG